MTSQVIDWPGRARDRCGMTTTSRAPARDTAGLLRFALRLDASATAVFAVAGLAAAPLLTGLLGIDTGLLRGLGAFFLGYAIALLLLAARRPVPRPGAWLVVLVNLAWAGVSAALMASGWAQLTAAGVVVSLLQAVGVVGFAALQVLGLRRAQ